MQSQSSSILGTGSVSYTFLLWACMVLFLLSTFFDHRFLMIYYNFTGYSSTGENTDISQELSPEKSVVTKSNSSNKSFAHPSTLLHCTDSGQHKGRSKANGEMTPLWLSSSVFHYQ